MLIFDYFENKGELTEFINPCCMFCDSILGALRFYESKTEEAKREGKSAIWFILSCQLYVTVVFTSPTSM